MCNNNKKKNISLPEVTLCAEDKEKIIKVEKMINYLLLKQNSPIKANDKEKKHGSS